MIVPVASLKDKKVVSVSAGWAHVAALGENVSKNTPLADLQKIKKHAKTKNNERTKKSSSRTPKNLNQKPDFTALKVIKKNSTKSLRGR